MIKRLKPDGAIKDDARKNRIVREMARRLNVVMESRGEDLQWLGRQIGVYSLLRVRALCNGNTRPTDTEQVRIDALLAQERA